MPMAITGFNKHVTNRIARRLVGLSDIVEIEHVGRVSGSPYRTPVMAFRAGDTMTIALTYGPDVDWLKNITAAGGCTMRTRRQTLTLGPPHRLGADEGLARMPQPARTLLRGPIGCSDFVELPILR